MDVALTVEPTAQGVAPAEVGAFTLTVQNPDQVFGIRADALEIQVNPARFDVNESDAGTRDRIDGKDTVWLARLFGSRTGDAAFDPDGDFDGDGWIDGDDLAFIASTLGRCWSGSAWTMAACANR